MLDLGWTGEKPSAVCCALPSACWLVGTGVQAALSCGCCCCERVLARGIFFTPALLYAPLILAIQLGFPACWVTGSCPSPVCTACGAGNAAAGS